MNKFIDKKSVENRKAHNPACLNADAKFEICAFVLFQENEREKKLNGHLGKKWRGSNLFRKAEKKLYNLMV